MSHNSSNVRDVTAGKVGRNSSNNNENGREETQTEVDGQSVKRSKEQQIDPKLANNREAWRRVIMTIAFEQGEHRQRFAMLTRQSEIAEPRLTSWRNLMAYFMLSHNGEESLNNLLNPDPDHLRGPSHGGNTSCVKKSVELEAIVFE